MFQRKDHPRADCWRWNDEPTLYHLLSKSNNNYQYIDCKPEFHVTWPWSSSTLTALSLLIPPYSITHKMLSTPHVNRDEEAWKKMRRNDHLFEGWSTLRHHAICLWDWLQARKKQRSAEICFWTQFGVKVYTQIPRSCTRSTPGHKNMYGHL